MTAITFSDSITPLVIRNTKKTHSCWPIISFITLFISLSTNAAVQFSKYRINLNEENSETSLLLMSSSNFVERCTLGLNHLQSLPNGVIKAVDSKNKTAYSAHDLFRFSPHRVNIPANGDQSVRIKMKRLKKSIEGEFTSFLTISCRQVHTPKAVADPTNTEIAETQIIPNITYKIPVIVRKGLLNASGSIKEANIDNNNVIIKLARQGNRSLHGNVTITDSVTNQNLAKLNGVSVFLPAESKVLTVPLKSQPKGSLIINFKEVTSEGGEQEFSFILNN
jgi:hypothetical protein